MNQIKFKDGNINYQVTKILKSGKISTRQGGMFYRFNGGRMLKVI